MILIIDFGSQYNQLIARRVRENHVFCQIAPPQTALKPLSTKRRRDYPLRRPSSIYETGSPRSIPLFLIGIPVLGSAMGCSL